MKKLFYIFLTALSFSADAQTYYGRQLAEQFPRNGAGNLTWSLTWLPQTYNNTLRRYPLIINLHGNGDNGTAMGDLTKVINASPRNVAGRIADGWNAIAVDPRSGIQDSFIVVSPQSASWSYGYAELKFILPAILAKYRVDTTSINIVALSAGGGGTWTSLGSSDSVFIKKFASIVTASSSGVWGVNGFTALEVEENVKYASKNWGVKIWTITGENDYLLNNCVLLHKNSNKLNPAQPNKLTIMVPPVGHNSWDRGYSPDFRPKTSFKGNTGNCNSGCVNGGIPVIPNDNGSAVRGTGITQDSLNIYEWILNNKRTPANTPMPVSVPGAEQTITLPTSSVTVNGGGSSGGTGATITAYLWQKVLGPSTFTISSPSSVSTTITGLVAGTYVFRLSVTNNIGLTHSKDIRITVVGGSYGHPIATLTSSATQNITSSSATVSLSYTLNGSGLKGIKWQYIKVPGQAAKKVSGIGSSTLAGSNASTGDSTMWSRLARVGSTYSLGTFTQLGTSGKSIFEAMPTGYTPTGAQDAPDASINVTAILAQSPAPDVVVVVFGSNDYDALSISEIMFAFQTIYNTVIAAGKKCYVATAQPRQAFGPSAQLFLREISDSIKLRFPNNYFDIHTSLTGYDGVTMLYPDPDLIHQQNTGHRVIGQNLIARNPWSTWATDGSVITSPTSATTTLTGLVNGTYVVMGTVTDNHEQSVNVFTTINVSSVSNNAPNASAGPDQTIILPVAQVTVSGSGSTDGDGTIVSYSWTKISGPSSFSILSPTSSSTVINGLVEGSYVFRLTVTDDDGATDTDDISVTVDPAPPVASCNGARYIVVGTGGAYHNTHNLKPGDTLFLQGTFSYVFLENRNGLPECPIVVMNYGGKALLRGNNIELNHCRYIKVSGSGSADEYGIDIIRHSVDTIYSGGFAVKVSGKSSHMLFERIDIRYTGIGFNIKQDESCIDSLIYPNMVMDSITIRHNRIRDCWNQGLYIGTTAPDNAADSYSPRPITCNGITVWPRPPRMGSVIIHDNLIERTGRPGIQLSSASEGFSRIYNNVVRQSGMTGDEAQGDGISIGAYTRVEVYDNQVSNTYAHGIVSKGGSGIPNIIFRNNTIDSSGYLQTYRLHVNYIPNFTGPLKISTAPVYNDSLNWPYSVFVQTKPNYDLESTGFTIKNNVLGRYKNSSGIIGLFDEGNNMRETGNIICGNTNSLGGSLHVNQEGSTSVTWVSDCGPIIKQHLRKKKNARHRFSN